MARRRYVAEYRWDGRAWIVQFRDPDIATFGRSLATAKRHARSALAVYLELADLAEAGLHLTDDVRLPSELVATIGELADQRSRSEALRGEVADATRRTASALRRLGLSTRDVGEILGISGARVAQIDREPGRG